jgi:hypothetical protein
MSAWSGAGGIDAAMEPDDAGAPPVGCGGAVIHERLADLPRHPDDATVYPRPVALARVHQDEATGAVHHVIRYPAGLGALAHTHRSAHTIPVLERRLVANGEVIGRGGYAHFPAGRVMRHTTTTEEPCLFVTMFDGPVTTELAE